MQRPVHELERKRFDHVRAVHYRDFTKAAGYEIINGCFFWMPGGDLIQNWLSWTGKRTGAMECNVEFNDVFPILLFGITFILIATIAILGNKKQKDKIKEIAAKLGLDYAEVNPFSFGADDKKSYRTIYAGQSHGMTSKDRPFLKKILQAFLPWQLRGKFNGYQVKIYTKKRNKKTYTMVQMSFNQSLSMGLNMTLAGNNLMSKLRKNIFGKSSIETGNREFDEKIHVSGRDEMKIKYVIKRPDFQHAMLALSGKYPDIKIDDQNITWQEHKITPDLIEYRPLLEDLSIVAKAISG